MIYAIEETKGIDYFDSFRLFETSTESIININEEELKNILNNYDIDIKSIYLRENRIINKQWFNPICHNGTAGTSGSLYILLCQVDKNRFKLISYQGEVTYVGVQALKEATKKNRIANCTLENGK